MRRASLYSSSNRSRAAARSGAAPDDVPPAPGKEPAVAAGNAAAPDAAAAPKPGRVARLRGLARRSERLLMLCAGALIAVAIVYGNSLLHPQSRELSQKDVDGAVMHTLETKTLPSQAAQVRTTRSATRSSACASSSAPMAMARIRARRRHRRRDRRQGDHPHQPARLSSAPSASASCSPTAPNRRRRSSRLSRRTTSPCCRPRPSPTICAGDVALDERPGAGRRGLAVGFPFGIGPSVTSGVVSGLRREYRSPKASACSPI